jgi:hypothetical protein
MVAAHIFARIVRNKIMKNIVFVSGLSGTGKSTLKEYFDKNPIDDFLVYDFDKGRKKCPKNEKLHHEWRTKQTGYWLDLAIDNLDKGAGTIIFGLCCDPQYIIKIAQSKKLDDTKLKFAYLTTESDERKQRLFDRGTPRHWQGEKPWYKDFYQQLDDVGAKEFNSSNKKVEDWAEEIINWLEQI